MFVRRLIWIGLQAVQTAAVRQARPERSKSLVSLLLESRVDESNVRLPFSAGQRLRDVFPLHQHD